MFCQILDVLCCGSTEGSVLATQAMTLPNHSTTLKLKGAVVSRCVVQSTLSVEDKLIRSMPMLT